MLKIFDFRCPDGHVFEKIVGGETKVCRCDCGLEATKQLSAPSFHLEGATGGFPTAHQRWVREHEKAGQKSSPQ